MRLKNFLTGCAVVAMGGAANAGGFVQPVSETSVAVVAPAIASSDWAGGYGGASIGYSFAADDEVGLEVFDGGELFGSQGALGRTDVKGLTAGLHLGYRWQRNSWVFGPELWLEGGKVDAQDRVVFTQTNGGTTIEIEGDIESKVNYLVGLQFKTGYVINSETLIYGTAGYVHGDFDLTFGERVGYTAGGYSLGLGAERKLRDNLSVFAEWQYRNFGRTDVRFGDEVESEVTRATPEHHNLKLGVNFRF